MLTVPNEGNLTTKPSSLAGGKYRFGTSSPLYLVFIALWFSLGDK